MTSDERRFLATAYACPSCASSMDDTEAALEKRIDSLLDVNNWDEALRSVKEYERFHTASKAYAMSVRAECAFRRCMSGKPGTGQGSTASAATHLKEAEGELDAAVAGGSCTPPVASLRAEVLLWRLVQARAGETPVVGGSRGSAAAGESPGPAGSSDTVDAFACRGDSQLWSWNCLPAPIVGLGGGSMLPLAATLASAMLDVGSDSESPVPGALAALGQAAVQVPIPELHEPSGSLRFALASAGTAAQRSDSEGGEEEGIPAAGLSLHRLWLWQRGLLIRAAWHAAQWLVGTTPHAQADAAASPPPHPHHHIGTAPTDLVLAGAAALGVWHLCCFHSRQRFRRVSDCGGASGMVWQVWARRLAQRPGPVEEGAPDSAASTTLTPLLQCLGRCEGDAAWRAVLHTPLVLDRTPPHAPPPGQLPLAHITPPAVLDADVIKSLGGAQRRCAATALLTLAGLHLWAGKPLWSAHLVRAVLTCSLPGGGKGGSGGPLPGAATFPSLSLQHTVAALSLTAALLGGDSLGRNAADFATGALDASRTHTYPSIDYAALAWDGPLLAPFLAATDLGQGGGGEGGGAAAAHRLLALAGTGAADRLRVEVGETVSTLADLALPHVTTFPAAYRAVSVWKGLGLGMASAGRAWRAGQALDEALTSSKHIPAHAAPHPGLLHTPDWQVYLLSCAVQAGALGCPAKGTASLAAALAHAGAEEERRPTEAAPSPAQPRGRWWGGGLGHGVRLAVGRWRADQWGTAQALLHVLSTQRRSVGGAGGGAGDLGGGSGPSTLAAAAGGLGGVPQPCPDIPPPDAARGGVPAQLYLSLLRAGLAEDTPSALQVATELVGALTQVGWGGADPPSPTSAQETKAGGETGESPSAPPLLGAGLGDAAWSLAALAAFSGHLSTAGADAPDAALVAAQTALGILAGGATALQGVEEACTHHAAAERAEAHRAPGVALAEGVEVAGGGGSTAHPAAAASLLGRHTTPLTRHPLVLLAAGQLLLAALWGGDGEVPPPSTLGQVAAILTALGVPVPPPSGQEPLTDAWSLVLRCVLVAATSLHTAALASLSAQPVPTPGEGLTAAQLARGDLGSDAVPGLPWPVVIAVHAWCLAARVAAAFGVAPSAASLPGAPGPGPAPQPKLPEAIAALHRAEGLLVTASAACGPEPPALRDALASVTATAGVLHECAGAPAAARDQFSAAVNLSPGHAEACGRIAWYAVHGVGAEATPKRTTAAAGAAMLRHLQRIQPNAPLAWALQAPSAHGPTSTPAASAAAVQALQLLRSNGTMGGPLPCGLRGACEVWPPPAALRELAASLGAAQVAARLAAASPHA